MNRFMRDDGCYILVNYYYYDMKMKRSTCQRLGRGAGNVGIFSRQGSSRLNMVTTLATRVQKVQFSPTEHR